MTIELKLERREQENETGVVALNGGGTAMFTPPIDEDYWEYRVIVSAEPYQAVVGFPKFGTVGVGFAVEEWSWNTNLPYRCKTDDIVEHIKKNRGSKEIKKSTIRAAVALIQAAAHEDRGTDPIKDAL